MTNEELLKNIYNDTQMMKAGFHDVCEAIKGLRSDVTELQTEVKELRSDVTELQTEVKELRSDVTELQSDVKSLKEDTKELKERVSKLELSLENETNRHIRILAENHLVLTEKLDEVMKISNRHFFYEIKVDSLEKRVSEIERRMKS